MFGKLLLILMLTIGSAYATEYKVTNGSVSVITVKTETNVFTINTPTSRIEFPESNGERLKVVATYSGPSTIKVPFASGAIVEQFGIKLRSVNTCNLVYIMRILSPNPMLSISYKQNIGMSTHAQCGDKGYVVAKNVVMPVRALDSKITLEAYFEANNVLVVKENDILVWKGPVAFNQTGLSGFRSDNVKVMFSIQ